MNAKGHASVLRIARELAQIPDYKRCDCYGASYQENQKGRYDVLPDSSVQRQDTGGKVITKCKTVTPPAGLTARKTERWVQEQADQFEKEVRNGLVLDSEMLLDDLIDRWFTEYAEKQLKAKTLYDYKKMRPRITAGLGHLKVCDIKPAHLMAFHNNLEEQGVRQDSTFTATPALLQAAASRGTWSNGEKGLRLAKTR